jgi:hypothetical protein
MTSNQNEKKAPHLRLIKSDSQSAVIEQPTSKPSVDRPNSLVKQMLTLADAIDADVDRLLRL